MKKIAILALLILSGVSIVLGQAGTATILGTVKDSSGAAVVGATLTARNIETGIERKVTSDSDGTYRFTSLAVGSYEVRAEAAGFKVGVRSGLTLTVTQEAVLDFSLQVGAVSQQVEVSAEALTVNTTNATLGALVNTQQVADLPLNGRNFVQLALLQTGITEQKNRTQNATAFLATQGTMYSSNGAPTRSNRYLLDGTNLAQYGFATFSSISGTTLGVDGIREFRLLTNSFTAEYGMSMGSQMIVVSKSGTNTLHGDVFGYLRNNALDARNFFDTSASAGVTASGAQRRLPPFRRINFGGSAGGPIRKDKTFVYGVYEAIREVQGLTQLTSTVPAGCRGAAGATIIAGSGPGQCSLITSNQIVSPLVAQWLTPLPLGSLAPIFPLPNVGLGQISWSYDSATQEDFGQMRVDHNISAADSVFGRFTIDNDRTGLPEAQPGFPTFPTSRGQWLTLAENHIFSPTLLNTFTAGYSRSVLNLGGPAYYNGPGYSYTPTGPADESGPNGFEQGTLTITGVATNGPGGLYVSKGLQSIYSYSDDLLYTHGNQALKFGTLINRYQIEAVNGTGSTGTLSFLNMTNFYNALASSYAIYTPGFDDRKDVRYWTLGFYVQDDIRVNPRFTLNLGFRYEPNTNMIVKDHKGTAIADPAVDAQPTTGDLMMQDPSWHNFSPRFGFAWDPKGDGKTAIRGGFSYLQNVSTWIGFLHLSIKELPQENPIVVTAPTTAGIPFTLPFTIPTNLPLTTRNPTSYQYSASNPQNAQPRGMYYNLSIQRQLPWSMVATLAYAGSRNKGLITYTQGNPTMPLGIPGTLAGNEACVAPPAGYFAPPIANQIYTDGKGANACWLGTESYRNQNWGSISYLQASGQSWYNGLQASLDKRVTNGLQFQTGLTWSRIFDTTESQSSGDAGSATSTNQQDPWHPQGDRSPASFDVPITFRFNMIYTFPTIHSNKFVEGFLNGWRVTPIYQAQSGSVFDVALGSTRALPIAVGTGGAADRPDWYAGRNPYNATHGVSSGCNGVAQGTPLGTPTLYFDPCAFYVQPRGFFGNVGRDSLRGPNYQTIDISLIKNTKARFLGEAGAVEFRLEGFNILNRANFATPNRTVYTGNGPNTNDTNEKVTLNAGAMINTLSSSRQVQVAVKIVF